MGSFPDGYRHPVVDDYRIGVANPQVCKAGTRQDAGIVSACVQTDHN